MVEDRILPCCSWQHFSGEEVPWLRIIPVNEKSIRRIVSLNVL